MMRIRSPLLWELSPTIALRGFNLPLCASLTRDTGDLEAPRDRWRTPSVPAMPI